MRTVKLWISVLLLCAVVFGVNFAFGIREVKIWAVKHGLPVHGLRVVYKGAVPIIISVASPAEADAANGAVPGYSLEWCDPINNGAQGNGIADDSGAINLCMGVVPKGSNYGFPTHITSRGPSGGAYRYRVASSIDGTGKKNCVITGDPDSTSYDGTIILGDTGLYPILDLSGSGNCVVRDLSFKVDGMNNPSQVGILMARTKEGSSSVGDQIQHVNVSLNYVSGIHNSYGTIGIYDYA